MHRFAFALFLCSVAPAFGSFGIFVSGAHFLAEDGVSPFPDDGLMQLINLGPNGVFDPVFEGSWVGGDDILINLPYVPFGAPMPEYATSGGFDLLEGEGSGEPGMLERVLDLPSDVPAQLKAGDPLGLRWWPGFMATDFHLGTTPDLGATYGQARVASPVNGVSNTSWVVPGDEDFLSILDPLVTADFASTSGGSLSATPGFDGLASAVVVIPEPRATALLAALGVGVLVLSQRRRNR